jgi:hypothetical protein
MSGMQRMRRAILAGIPLLLGATEAVACTCANISRDQVIAATPVVFDGEILRIEMDAIRQRQVTTFRVREAIKGVPPRVVLRLETVLKRMPQRTITIISGLGEAACGWDFSAGPARLTVGAERDGPNLVATRCTMAILNGRRWIP